MIWRHIINILIGLALGAIVVATMSYASIRWDNAVVFSDVRAVVALSTRGHERWLAVRYRVMREHNCPSWSQHLLFRDNIINGVVQRNYVPLAITSNGIGGGLQDTEFALSFRLPAALMPGVWHYTVVTSSSCEWLPGLQRENTTQTAPVEVRIR